MFDIVSYWNVFRKAFSRNEWLLLGGVFMLFLVMRVINLDQFPIFGDEGIYIRWSKVAWKDATWRFISLTDGRQPLQTWGTIPFLKIFENNALLGARLFSVTTGLFALIGLTTLTRYLFNARTALMAGFLYVVTPYFLFYDRIALVDSGINAFTIWIFLLSIVLARTRRIDVAIILGLVSGMALLGKSSVRLYLALSLFAGIFVVYSENEGGLRHMLLSLKRKFVSDKLKIPAVVSFVFLYLISIVLAGVLYNVQRLSPFMHFIEEKNTTFILTSSELLADPLNYFSNNIVNLPYYIFSEMGFVIAVIGIVGMYFMYKRNKAVTIYLGIWLVFATLLISLVARVLFPRYVLSLGGLLLVPAAYLLGQLKNKTHIYGMIGIVLLSVIYFDYTIIFDHKNIPFPQVDRGQYIEGWPAGWGIRDIIEYSRDKSLEKPVVILAEGSFGMTHDVLDAHTRPNDKIKIVPHWPLDLNHLFESQHLLLENHVFVVFAHKRDFSPDWPMELVKVYDKPGDESEIYFYKLLNSPTSL